MSGTALPAGDAPAPPAVVPDYAARRWGAAEMQAARDALRREHGGGKFSQLIVDLAEVRLNRGRDAFAWEIEGWYGGDVDRVVIKNSAESEFGEKLHAIQTELLYSRAIGPYFDLQAGVRQDFGEAGRTTHVALGVEGLAPYWFELEAVAYLSTRGDVTGKVEASYDQRVTQRLILQPRVELGVALQDVARAGVGAGPTDLEAGLRLRYEIAREFAPYVGVNWHSRLGRTARLARAAGDDVAGAQFVIGVRAWY